MLVVVKVSSVALDLILDTLPRNERLCVGNSDRMWLNVNSIKCSDDKFHSFGTV
jgi:hypothetical protein